MEISKSDSRKTWNLINELSSRHCNKSNNISEIKIGDHVINTPAYLAIEILQTDVDPELYLFPTDAKFSFQAPTVNLVHKLLSGINERKATGLDKIPCKLLKMAANLVAPSATESIIKSISTNVFPKEWKLAGCRYLREVRKMI